MWWIIFGIIGFLAIVMLLFFIGLAKQKNGDILTIFKDDNVIELLLTDDNYMTIDISDIKDDIDKINNKLREVIKSRAFELKSSVTKVSFVQRDDKAFSKELLNIIQKEK